MMTPYETDSKLVSFLYTLLRDELPAGVVEGLVQVAEVGSKVTLLNGDLAKYAVELSKRLMEEGYAYDVIVRGTGPYRISVGKNGVNAVELLDLALAMYGVRVYERGFDWEMCDAVGRRMISLGKSKGPLSNFELPFYVDPRPGWGG